MPLKVVLDTNTLISAFFWDGNEAELFRRIEQGKVELYITGEILAEIENVIRRPKFDEIRKKANVTPNEIMQKIISLSHVIIAQKVGVAICRDKKDNKFLECAESAKADYLVSGDEDLLILKKYKETTIINTSKLLQGLE